MGGTKSSSDLRRLLITALAGASAEVEKLTSKEHQEQLRTWADSLVTSLSTVPTDLSDVADRDWGEVWTLRQCFGRRERAVAFLRGLNEALAEVLRRIWAMTLAADIAIVEVFAAGQSHTASSLAGYMPKVPELARVGSAEVVMIN